MPIPSEVIWSYGAAGVVFVIGLAAVVVRGDWRRAHGVETLLLLGPLFYAAPLAAFGVEHFTLTDVIAAIVPSWMPWHRFWAYFVGACFIAAALSFVTGIQTRLAASLVALNFFLFVVLMDLPAWARRPRSGLALSLALRQLAFSGGALALAAALGARRRERSAVGAATVARYFVAVPVLWYAFEQFVHGDRLPGVPLNRVTPAYIYGHAVWTYMTAVVYLVAGVMLVAGRQTRAAAVWLGTTVLAVELFVYVPIGIVDRASLALGLNYVLDTLLFCGAVLLLAGAMPPEASASSHRSAVTASSRPPYGRRSGH